MEQSRIDHESGTEQGEEENEKGKQVVLGAAAEEEDEEVGEEHGGVTVEVAAAAWGEGRGIVAWEDVPDLGVEKEGHALTKGTAEVGDEIHIVAVVA